MGTSKTDLNKRFNSGTAYVSLIPNVLPNTDRKLTDQQKLDDFFVQKVGPPTVSIRSFLKTDKESSKLVKTARSLNDCRCRKLFIHKMLPAIVVPVKVWSRDFTQPYESLIKEYNSLIMLEFPVSQGTGRLISLLKTLPWVWYFTLSADGENILAIVPLDNNDYYEHYRFYEALKREFSKRGFQILDRCEELVTLMFKTDDPQAWMNEHCTLYRLPGHHKQTINEE